jgi:hypothetical protein
MEHTFGSWVEVSIYRNPASSPLSLSMRFDANRANNTRDFGRVSAAFRVSSNLNSFAVFWSHRGLGVGRWSAAGLYQQSSAVPAPGDRHIFSVIPRRLEIQPVIEALVLAAADVLFDPPAQPACPGSALTSAGRPPDAPARRANVFKETGAPSTAPTWCAGWHGGVVLGAVATTMW